jgi:hypothetical protein
MRVRALRIDGPASACEVPDGEFRRHYREIRQSVCRETRLSQQFGD